MYIFQSRNVYSIFLFISRPKDLKIWNPSLQSSFSTPSPDTGGGAGWLEQPGGGTGGVTGWSDQPGVRTTDRKIYPPTVFKPDK